MKAVPAKLGASPKQIKTLGVLGLILIGVFVYNYRSSGPDQAASSPTASRTALNPAAPIPLAQRGAPPLPMPSQGTPSRGANRQVQDFRPSLKLPEGTDVSKIDPTLKLDLLAKLQKLEMAGGARSIFAFSQPPAPPPPKIDPIKPGPTVITNANPGGGPDPNKPAAPAAPPPPPPIPLKFFGYANTPRGGARRAFFLDSTGDEIFVAGENDMIRNRYRIIRIGVNSAVVEDTTNKNQQTLPLVEELAG
jgi:hypothetical protein